MQVKNNYIRDDICDYDKLNRPLSSNTKRLKGVERIRFGEK
jgi:hypothetical protein